MLGKNKGKNCSAEIRKKLSDARKRTEERKLNNSKNENMD